jgi:hypothetical protein
MIDETSLWFIIVWIFLTFAMFSYICILRLDLTETKKLSDFHKEMRTISEQHIEVLKERIRRNEHI